MENIIVVETTETYEDKINKYKITGDPETFIALEAYAIKNDMRYNFVNSVDKLLNEVFKTYVYALAGDYIVNPSKPIFFKNTVESPLLMKYSQIGISAIHTIARESSIISYDELILGNNNIYTPKQFEITIAITAEELFQRVYRPLNYNRWIHQVLRRSVKNPINIMATNAIQTLPSTRFLKEYKYMADIFEMSPFVCPIFINFARKDYIDILAGKSPQSFVDYYKSLKTDANNLMNNLNVTIWSRIEAAIARLLNIPFDGQFTSVELKIIKQRKNLIINKFIREPCEHEKQTSTLNISDLKLVGDFYDCPHGNHIICRHTTYDRVDATQIKEFFIEFGHNLDGGIIVCKICGEELLKNPEFVMENIDPSIGNIGYDDIFRKYLFKKSLIMLGQVSFKIVISSDFTRKIAGLITSSIFNLVSTEFEKIEKIKGIPEEVIQAFKEIIANIYIYCSYVISSLNNKKIFVMRGITIDRYIDAKHIAMIAKRLEYMLHTSIEQTKNYKSLNLVNLVQSIMQEINRGNIPILPRDSEKNPIQTTALYQYFAPIADVTEYPKISNIESGLPYINKINSMFVEIITAATTIGNPIVQDSGSTLYVYDNSFTNYIDRFNNLNVDEYEYITDKLRSYWKCRTFPGTPISIPTYDPRYIGFKWGRRGGIHMHVFNQTYVNGTKTMLNNIETDNMASAIYCSICGEEGAFIDITKDITNNLILQSKQIYFMNFCPVKTIHEYKNNICSCGYKNSLILQDNNIFFAEHSLPSVSTRLFNADYNIRLIDECKNSNYTEAKYYGSMPKDVYRNFWHTLGTYEDVTYKNLLKGVRGGLIVGQHKLYSQFIWLNNLLSRIANLANNPNKLLQAFGGEETTINKLLVQISNILNETCHTYEYLRDQFVNIYNELPRPLAEYVLRELIRNTEAGAMSEEKTKVEALINYKNKTVDENIDIDKGGEEGDLFSYEGYDYDGKNE